MTMTTTDAQDEKFLVTSEYVDISKLQIDPLIKALKRAEVAEKKAKEKTAAARQTIIDLMRGAEILRAEETEQELVTHRVVEAMVIDTARLKKEKPAVAAEYQKPRTSRPFKVLV